MGAVIETRGLRRSFGRVTALDGLDLSVAAGSIFGCLGPNGAGKTTTIRILLGLIKADAGEAFVLGRRVRRGDPVISPVGAMIERPAFYPYLSGRDNLRVFAAARGIEPERAERLVDAALDRVDLDRAARRRGAGGYSTGMLQRLGIALAIMDGPPLLILDEPTTGLDPQGQIDVRELIGSLARDGVTVFLSTHMLAEAEQLCTQLVVIDRGRAVAAGAAADLFERRQRLWVRCGTASDRDRAIALLTDSGLRASPEAEAGCLVDGEADGSRVIRLLSEAGLYPAEVAIRRPSLEQLYVELTAPPQEAAT